MSQKRYVFDDAQKSRFLTYQKRNMKKIYFFGLILSLILIAGCVTYSKTKTSSPEIVIKSMLPKSWALSVEENVTPTLWKGNAECKLIKLNNPSEKYFEPSGGFNYTAWHDFWFCPKDWVGEAPNIPMMAQEYPPGLLCDCKDYKIYHISLGDNSQKDLPEKIKNEFGNLPSGYIELDGKIGWGLGGCYLDSDDLRIKGMSVYLGGIILDENCNNKNSSIHNKSVKASGVISCGNCKPEDQCGGIFCSIDNPNVELIP